MRPSTVSQITALRASLAAALMSGLLAVAGCSSPPACAAAAGSCLSPLPPRVMFVTTINGHSAARPLPGPVPSFRVRPGEHLVMQVAVTVPRHVRVTALWVGVCKNSWGWGPGDRLTGMNPILTYSRRPLPAGVHTFGLRWRFREGRSGASLYLCVAWLSRNPSSGRAGAIAVLAPN